MKIKVLLVESSENHRDTILQALEADNRFTVCGIAINENEAVEMSARLKPDVVAMETGHIRLDGLSATKKIMGASPVPIVLLSKGFSQADQSNLFKALEAGAVALIAKPDVADQKHFTKSIENLKQTLALMSEVKVVRRIKRRSFTEYMPNQQQQATGQVKLIAIGASTGGPQVIEKILAGLTPGFSIPIVIVQHITSGFVEGFSSWLNMTAKVHCTLAKDREILQPGFCYIAPDDYHLELMTDNTLALLDSEAEHSAKPSISVLFRSIGLRCAPSAVAIALTGMGKDGAAELGIIHQNGGVTIAQDMESSLIFGIPGEAVRLKAAQFVFNPAQIIEYLNNLHKTQITY